MNKQGFITKSIFAIPRLFMLILVLFSVVFLVRSFVITEVDVTDLEAQIVKYRLTHGIGGVSYHDLSTGRVYPGIIDKDRFTLLSLDDTLLDNAISYGDQNMYSAARIELIDTDQTLTTFYNKQQFLDWHPKSQLSTVDGGSGEVSRYEFTDRVLIKQQSTQQLGLLKITILI